MFVLFVRTYYLCIVFNTILLYKGTKIFIPKKHLCEN